MALVSKDQNEQDRRAQSEAVLLAARLRNIDGDEIARINAELRARDEARGISVVNRLHRADARSQEVK